MESWEGNCSKVPCKPLMADTTLSQVDNHTNSSSGNTSAFDIPFLVLSEDSKIGLIFLYSLTTVLAIMGNLLVVLVFCKGRRCRTDIRPFLINLAVADLIMALFCMPFTFTSVMLKTWLFSKPMCPVVLFMQHLSVSASVFTNMAIGIDRLLVVMFPLKSRLTSARAKYVLVTIWVSSIGLSSVQLVVGRAYDVRVGDYHLIVCDETWTSPLSRRIFTLFVLFITYIMPLFILSVTYSIVGILLWTRTSPGNADEARDLQQLKTKRKVVKMLVIVVCIFGLCWLPLHTFIIVIDFNPHLLEYKSEQQEVLFTAIYYFAHWLAMSNSFANPIIYGFTNDSFRSDLAGLFYLWFPFCSCLKKMVVRKLSMSTYETGVPRRQSTMRKPPQHAAMKQSVRNGHKVYFELRRSLSKDDDENCRIPCLKSSNAV
ncbi:prolactin-releasing peptide receptor-like [Haliotis asinina]|uniref:prolactin-releasing peptide receptor-like n=1 Tax=Haliotis asinina TaxID=109174 RepID=UPI00353257A2